MSRFIQKIKHWSVNNSKQTYNLLIKVYFIKNKSYKRQFLTNNTEKMNEWTRFALFYGYLFSIDLSLIRKFIIFNKNVWISIKTKNPLDYALTVINLGLYANWGFRV